MNKKIIIIVSLVAILLISSIITVLLAVSNKNNPVHLNEVFVDDLKVRISGTIKNITDNEQVTIVVFEKGKSAGDISAVIYLDQGAVVKNGDDGIFEFSFTAPEKARGNKYKIMIGASGLEKSVICDKVIYIKK